MTRGVRLAKHVWIFGGQERGDKTKMFCCIVEKRDKETLLPLIEENIAPGSRIISDGWKSYFDIGQLPSGYHHDVVNHTKYFKDPVSGAHINTIGSHSRQPTDDIGQPSMQACSSFNYVVDLLVKICFISSWVSLLS
ncbi:hypothetical protein PRIPAC_73374, partial [Pristionchus pacificus]|uniref:DDE_Tnp_IS1595 domain-containing protein n=1 Tax=Pristionchus pacificus TaxID=54126 RepID=A0A2A6CSH7_PRIPA